MSRIIVKLSALMKKEFILNDTKIYNLKSFFKEIERELIVDLNAIENWTFDVFDDIFYGGYGLYELNEEIIIKWTNFNRSKQKMTESSINSVMDILRYHSNIELIID